jgi:FMN reductase (NADPH)
MLIAKYNAQQQSLMENNMSYETLLEITNNRRSIRKFSDKPVSREDIEKIVQLGMMAPSGFNAQMWEIVAVDDKLLRDKITDLLLSELGKSSKGFISAPLYLLMYADERVRKYGPAAKIDNDAWWEFTLNSSMSCAFMNIQLAASSLGLGSMWVSAFRNPAVEQPTRELLNIPSHLRVYEMLAIGYPGMMPGKKKLREMSTTLHFNQADNYRSQQELDSWF